DMYRCFSIPTNSTADQYVQAIDIRPGDRQTVHHVIAFIDTDGSSAMLTGSDGGGGYPCFGGPGFQLTNIDATMLGGWAPGYRAVTMPDDVGLLLPKGSRVVLQVHYHPHGPAPLPDQTQIGLYFRTTKPKQLMRVLPLINQDFRIPAGNANYRVSAELPSPLNLIGIPFDAHVWLIAPHMHLLGRKMHVSAITPAGQNQCLVDVEDWDFNWQGMYRFKDAVAMPTGTKLSLEAFYDNSAGNFRNPNDPPKDVTWGEATTDEMCIAFLGFTIDSENLLANQTVDTSWVPKIRFVPRADH
ncbi:MAG TPA: hypothetical protein VJ853_13375, partial [Thermoanaerobaculia bacterium]|nr:hypothetical protein [Thermoanaerobaculia bacterium]